MFEVILVCPCQTQSGTMLTDPRDGPTDELSTLILFTSPSLNFHTMSKSGPVKEKYPDREPVIQTEGSSTCLPTDYASDHDYHDLRDAAASGNGK